MDAYLSNVEDLLTSPYEDVDEKMNTSRSRGQPSGHRYVNNPLRPGDTAEAGVPDSLAPLRELQELTRMRQEGESMMSILAKRKGEKSKNRFSITRSRKSMSRTCVDQGVQCTLLDDVDLEVGEPEETEEGVPSPNPMFSETPLRRQSAFRVRPRRAAVITRDDTVPCPDIESLEIDNPRAYFLARAERKIFQKAFVDRSDKLYTTLFVMLFKPLRFTTVNRTRAARTVPRFCVVMLLAITFMFSTLISEYGATTQQQGVSSTFHWFIPHIISTGRQSIGIVELRQWGGATRCLVVDDGDFWRLFTAPFIHVTSNQYCANIIGLFVWGLHFESRYGCARFVVVTILSLVGGLLMGLLWTDSNVFVVGADGAIAAHANMFLLDMLLNSKEKVTTKIFFGLVTMGFVTYALVTNSKNTISLYVGGVVPSFFFCYMFQSHFASERIEVILFLGSLSITILYFVTVPLLVYMLPRGSKCVVAP